MWQASYGKEPFDLRLTALLMFKRLGIILAATVVGTILFGGGYYVKNVIFGPDPVYRAVSTYRIEYRVYLETDINTIHINEMTWNTYLDTEMFLDDMRSHLTGSDEYTDDELKAATSAVVAANLKVLAVTVDTPSPERSMAIDEAVQKTLVLDFPNHISEVTSVSVMDPAGEAQAVYPDVRPVRAVILSAVLTFFFTVVILFLKELADDNIWLPSTIRRRYALKTAGTPESRELLDNLGYFYRDMKNIAVCPMQKDIDPAQVIEVLKSKGTEKDDLWKEKNWIPVPSPLICPEGCGALRDADGILLVVKAGRNCGKQLEYVIELLGQQDCEITSVLLWNADELLLRVYYGFGRRGGKAHEG